MHSWINDIFSYIFT